MLLWFLCLKPSADACWTAAFNTFAQTSHFKTRGFRLMFWPQRKIFNLYFLNQLPENSTKICPPRESCATFCTPSLLTWRFCLYFLLISVYHMVIMISLFHQCSLVKVLLFSPLLSCPSNQMVHFSCACQFSHPQSITAVWSERTCVFFSEQIREELKLTSISGCTFSFYILSPSEQWEEPEDMKECESAAEIKRKSSRKTRLSVRTFILCLLKFFFSCILSLCVLVRRSWVIKTPTFPTRGNKSN